ncbi:bleomycin resistance protein [Cypionkella aquatica]|uniref:Bleomycin resistance protein n=1 Tax=Cypionkella aquatica TaxID=1756042 RepID=A0AA37U0I8_9RHOB|nr:bleomycin resistance protein [Cypionkella aquatica]GLS86461.1 bleomycin resistance protein [Cypionkella aquatica]
MADRITANLPSRDFTSTEAFYARLGFATRYRDDGWMILRRGSLELEFFHHPGVDKLTSWFSACIRIDDMPGLLTEWQKVGLPSDAKATPRLTGIFKHGQAPRMFALVDEDGSLLRVIDNLDAGEAA